MKNNEALRNRPIQKITDPFVHFMHLETSGGLVLLGCTIIAILIANSTLASSYHAFWNQFVSLNFGGAGISYPLWYWVNDGLMVIFFFVIGLELKRELTTGELSESHKIILPAAAAVGGAIVPACIFLFLQQGQPAQNGWAIPMATDIAFVVGVISLLGKRVPHSLKIFLLSVAIVDDLLAVSVIALFYTETIHLSMLLLMASGFVLIVVLNKLRVRNIGVYVIVGILIWFFALKSGIHPTIAGVILGLMTPAYPLLSKDSASATLTSLNVGFQDDKSTTLKQTKEIEFATRESISPLERLENALHPWGAFVIIPIFALANAAVLLDFSSIQESVSIAIILGLMFGKPIGILLASFIVTAFGWTKLPSHVNWMTMLGAGVLAGIGFTMSLFIASLALEGTLLEVAKGGILVGSAISMVIGFTLLFFTLKNNNA